MWWKYVRIRHKMRYKQKGEIQVKQPKIIFRGKEHEVKEIEWKDGEIKKIRFYIGDNTRVIFQNAEFTELTENHFGHLYIQDLSGIIA